MNRGDPQCRRVVEILTDYLEGALGVEDRVALEQHLLLCGPCAIYLEQLRSTIELTGLLREEDVPPEVMAGVVGLLEEGQDV